MKVTIVGLNYAPEHTGIAVYTSGLAESLAASGHAIEVIAGYPHYPQWHVHDGYTGRVHREQRRGVSVKRLSHYVPARPRVVNRAGMEAHFGIRALLAGWKRPDVVVLVAPALISTGLASLRAKILGYRTCIWVQDIYSLGIQQSGAGGRIAAALLRRVERSILGSGSTIVVIHERFKRYLVDELKLPEERIEVVRNWSHVGKPSGVDRTAVRDGRGWAADDIVVLHAGNMGAKQGLDNVVLASRLASERGSAVRFVLLGDGNQRERLEAMDENPNLEFIAPVDDADFMPLLASADILLVNELPGLTEMSVPSKLTSYFSTGLPVIAATDKSSVTADEIERAGGGIRVDADDPAALVAAAERLGGDKAAAAALGRAGLEFRASHLTPDAALAAFESILDSRAQNIDAQVIAELNELVGETVTTGPSGDDAVGDPSGDQFTTTARNSTGGPSA